jgi:hypothetical protein
VRAADLADPAQAITVARGAAVIYQVLNPPYHRWAAEWPALWHPIGDQHESPSEDEPSGAH